MDAGNGFIIGWWGGGACHLGDDSLQCGVRTARSTPLATVLSATQAQPPLGYGSAARKVSPTTSTRPSERTLASTWVESVRCCPRALRYPCSRNARQKQ